MSWAQCCVFEKYMFLYASYAGFYTFLFAIVLLNITKSKYSITLYFKTYSPVFFVIINSDSKYRKLHFLNHICYKYITKIYVFYNNAILYLNDLISMTFLVFLLFNFVNFKPVFFHSGNHLLNKRCFIWHLKYIPKWWEIVIVHIQIIYF